MYVSAPHAGKNAEGCERGGGGHEVPTHQPRRSRLRLASELRQRNPSAVQCSSTSRSSDGACHLLRSCKRDNPQPSTIRNACSADGTDAPIVYASTRFWIISVRSIAVRRNSCSINANSVLHACSTSNSTNDAISGNVRSLLMPVASPHLRVQQQRRRGASSEQYQGGHARGYLPPKRKTPAHAAHRRHLHQRRPTVISVITTNGGSRHGRDDGAHFNSIKCNRRHESA